MHTKDTVISRVVVTPGTLGPCSSTVRVPAAISACRQVIDPALDYEVPDSARRSVFGVRSV